MKLEQASKGESGVLFFSLGPLSVEKKLQLSTLALALKEELSLWELLPLSDRWGEKRTDPIHACRACVCPSSPWGVVGRVIEYKW